MNELLFALDLLDTIADYLDLCARNKPDEANATKALLFQASHAVSTASVAIEGYADTLEGVLEGDTEAPTEAQAS